MKVKEKAPPSQSGAGLWQVEQTAAQAQGYDGPYSPPARPCYICKRRAWRWNGQGYECGSGDPAHAERERDMQEHPERYYAFWKSRPWL